MSKYGDVSKEFFEIPADEERLPKDILFIPESTDNLDPEEIDVCYECGSDDLERKAWLGLKKNDFVMWCEDELYYCRNCGESVQAIPRRTWKQIKDDEEEVDDDNQ